MSNLLTLFSFACSAFALIYGLWFANSMYFGFSFIPSKLEKILKIGIATRSDVAQYMDIGGLDKDSKFYGLDINNANFKYDEKTSRLINYSLFTSYKTTGILSAAAPADVRAALNKACDATDNQWVITDGFMTYKGNNLMCLYHKDDKGYLLSVSFEPTSSPVPTINPIISNAAVSTVRSTVIPAGALDNEKIKKTRYGSLRFTDKNGKISLYLNDKIFATTDGNSANDFGESFVISEKDIVVFYNLAGGGCGTYQFISVVSQTNASMSQSFYSCGEIVFQQNNSKIITESMDYQGENKKQVIYENGAITENNKDEPVKEGLNNSRF